MSVSASLSVVTCAWDTNSEKINPVSVHPDGRQAYGIQGKLRKSGGEIPSASERGQMGNTVCDLHQESCIKVFRACESPYKPI